MAAITPERQAAPSGFKRWWNRSATTRTAWLYLAPAFFIMIVITFYPLFYQVWMSLTDYGIKNLRFDAAAPNFVGIKNYAQIFSGELPVAIANFNFWNVLAFNLIWTFTNVPFHVIIGVLIAVLLNVKGLWFKRFYRAIYILPDRAALISDRRRLAQHVRPALWRGQSSRQRHHSPIWRRIR